MIKVIKESSDLFVGPECIGRFGGRLRHEGDGVLATERGKLDSCSNTLKPQGVPAAYRHGGRSQDYLKVRRQRNASVVLAFRHARKNSYRTGSYVMAGCIATDHFL